MEPVLRRSAAWLSVQVAKKEECVAPGSLDLLSVEFAAGEDADGFVLPAWFGPEVTRNPAYHRGSLARTGLPASSTRIEPQCGLRNARSRRSIRGA